MKKIAVLLIFVLATLFLAGCTFLSWMPASTNTPTYMTVSRTTTVTTIPTVDLDRLIDDIYAKIMADLYDDIRDEVIEQLADQQFALMYADLLDDILTGIAEGDITLAPQSVLEAMIGVVETQAQAVVGVSNYDSGGTLDSIGSGVIYRKTGNNYYVVTNHHVIEDNASIRIRFSDGSTLPGTVLGSDTTADIAVVRFVSEDTYQVAPFGDSSAVKQGTIILAVGHPKGYEFYNSVTFGIVSGVKRYFDTDGDGIRDMFVGYLQHDAAINSGNSGGPLFNLAGEVIGINVIKIASTEIEGMGFAIPSALVSAICEDIEVYGVSRQIPALGIELFDIATTPSSTFIQEGITIPSHITAGFYVRNVVVGSTVDGFVLPGDIIVQVGDIEITRSIYFTPEFQKYRVGETIDIVLYRSGDLITVTVELKPKVG
ncbi:MAG: trypsin-like peptidase domain-containing protein [Candidatus Izemoplasmatales bacterium]|nr:trypsin-like peptidase domain-containing protein [Candidatus Izemoplasmatales bacterium]